MKNALESHGIIALGAEGKVVFAAGSGDRPELQQKLLEYLEANAQANPGQRLFTLNCGEARHVVLMLPLDKCSVYLVHASESEETLLDFIASVDFSHTILNHLVSSPFEGMVVVDENAKVLFISPVHASSLGLSPGEGIGQAVNDVIRNSRLQEVVQTGKAEIGQILEVKGEKRVVNRRPVFKDGRVVGAIGQLMFKAPEQLHEFSREVDRLKSEVTFYQRELSVIRSRAYGLEQIIGNSEAVRELKSDIARVAPLDVPVLLVGESGTGKELVAHAIHSLSHRNERPLVVVNSAALPAHLVESEMFGYEPGAFTGADRKGRKGKFELADKSTLFLDEIGDMPLTTQVKLLRVLQDGMFERIGGDRARYSGFRLICASHRDLKKMISAEEFRLDLYYRISGVVLRLPPLRDRLEDIPALVDNFLEAYSRRHQAKAKSVHRNVYSFLKEQPWPGNVRQLLHEVEKAIIFADSDELQISDFGTSLEHGAMEAPPAASQGTIHATVSTVEDRLIKEALTRHKGNKSRVASELGISRSYLYKKIRELA